MPSPSLFRYLVSSDCFGRLRMGLFGYFVDDKATAKAIPFCRSLVRLAVASNDARLRIFILDNLLPCLIQHLDNELPCAILRLKCKLKSSASDSASANDNAGRDLVVLCQDLYGYLLNSGYVLTQALAGEDKNNADAESSFQVWLERQKKDFRLKAYSAAKELPNGYLWKWEFEDEFQRYLSAYIDMLQEVDAMDDCAENIYMDKESLFRKLRPEFRSKYAINSCVHPYMVTISSIRQRKVYSMTAVVRNRKICNFLRKLIELKPYIKVSDRSCDVISRLKQAFEIPAELSKCDVAPSVELLLRSVLFFWEPRYHPMIRQAHKDKLLGVVDRLTARESLKPVMPIIRDFPLHLQPYAQAFVETKLKESKYFIAKEQIRLHEEFDKYLASREMDLYMDQLTSSKVDFVEDLVANKLLPSQFLVLERFLMELSFERRAEIVQMQTEIDTYSECLCGLFKNELLKRRVKSSISELEAEGFFDVDSNCVNWGKPSFSELIDRFHHEVFCRHSLPKHHAIRGLIDCRAIFLREDIDCQEAVKKVVVDVCNELTGYLPKFWEDTRYYEHQYYAIIRDPLKQVILAPCTN
uniref:Uncharacterized protein n=1 Tax=Arundo donax TaxID=35708 RepID=A0A0A8Z654_ARUDO